LPRVNGRPSVTPIARSSPRRIAPITPVAAQRKTSSEISPAALAGVAIAVMASSTSLRPPTETGRASTIVLVTLSRSSSFWSTSPKIETSTIARGAIENSSR
jgi:hypothetical protein